MIGQGVKNRFQDMKTQTKLLVSFGLVSVIIMLMASVGVFTLAPAQQPITNSVRRLYGAAGRFAQMGTALTSITKFCWMSRRPRNKPILPRR